MKKIVPVVLCGGYGKRLSPLSTEAMPKQFLRLHGKCTLFQDTLRRVKSAIFCEPIIVSNSRHSDLLESQIREVDCSCALNVVETETKNTTVSVALAAMYCQRYIGKEAILLILPSDHYIGRSDIFMDEAVMAAYDAEYHPTNIVLCGVYPQFPETNYGYIKCGAAINNLIHRDTRMFVEADLFHVERFVEKPSFTESQGYIASGNYYWNSGVYVAKVGAIIAAIKVTSPLIYLLCKRAVECGYKHGSSVFPTFSRELRDIDCFSFDKAVTEKYPWLLMRKMSDVMWYDLGSFHAIDMVNQLIKTTSS